MKTLFTSIVSIVLHFMVEVEQHILEHAQALFCRLGIRGVTMDDVASGVGISKKTLYQYFSDKNSLVEDVFKSMLEVERIKYEGYFLNSENAVHFHFLSIEFLLEMSIKMNPVLFIEANKYYFSTFKLLRQHKLGFKKQLYKKNIERGKREGLFREDIDAEIVVQLMFSVSNLFERMLEQTDEFLKKYTFVDILHQANEFFLYGFASQKGIRLIQKYKQERKNINIKL